MDMYVQIRSMTSLSLKYTCCETPYNRNPIADRWFLHTTMCSVVCHIERGPRSFTKIGGSRYFRSLKQRTEISWNFYGKR